VLTSDEILGLTDRQLHAWYRNLKTARQDRHMEGTFDNPKQVRWCYHEARRELTKRGLRTYKESAQ